MAVIFAILLKDENRFMLKELREKKSQMSFKVPSLNSIRVFEAAARHLSFVKAADELCVTHGAVSRQIKQLEAALGLSLFDRRNRAVFLTREGVQLQNTCQDVMQRLEDGIRKLCKPKTDAPLVLSCEPTIAMRWLIPRLPRFQGEHPDITVLLLAAGGVIDFSTSHVDLALRRNDFNWGPECYAEPVGREWVAPVCAPSLLENGHLWLDQQFLLHTNTRLNAWDRWREKSGTTMAYSIRSARYEHFYLSLQAAGAGLGVAIGSIYMVEEDLASQRLIAPFGFSEDGSEYMLLSPRPFTEDERRSKLLAWLRAEFYRTRDAGL